MRALTLLAFLLILTNQPTALWAQTCQGSLGENIFEEGDFGSGSSNLVTTDPGIAPGYIYDTNPPPEDGFYVLTNDMGGPAWGNRYGSWAPIRDNSGDPNGYMMVVNASFSPGIFYEQVVDNLCENTTYEFSADVINVVRIPTTGHSLPNLSFLLNDVVFLESGGIAQDEQWKTFGFTFTTLPGQSSMKLTLRNNAPGGIGNDLALDNISFRACGPTAVTSTDEDGKICEDDLAALRLTAVTGDTTGTSVIQWQKRRVGEDWEDIPGARDETYTVTERNPGNYEFRYIYAPSEANLMNIKCRTLSDPIPLEVVPKTWSFTDSICVGSSLRFGGEDITEAGTYYDSLTSSIGCDSFITLELVVLPNSIPIEIVGTNPSCPSDTNGMIEFFGAPELREPYNLTVNGAPRVLRERIRLLPEGNYQIRITDRFGCEINEDILLQRPNPLILTGRLNFSSTFGDLVPVDLNTNYRPSSIEWDPDLGLSCDDCLDPDLFSIASTNYILTLTDSSGCEYRYTLNLEVADERPFYIPTAFSPNGDGVNDHFQVFVKEGTINQIDNFTIYDRWGGKIFSIQDGVHPDLALWDGLSNGDKVATGIYLYAVEVTWIDGRKDTYQGSLNLIR